MDYGIVLWRIAFQQAYSWTLFLATNLARDRWKIHQGLFPRPEWATRLVEGRRDGSGAFSCLRCSRRHCRGTSVRDEETEVFLS